MSADAPTPDFQATTDVALLAGRYQLLEKLGAGGMGAVFRARDAKLERAVAIKMLPEGSAPDEGAVARFRREARALARLSHPGIIQAHDSGEEGGRPFLVMELVQGQSLAALLREQGRVAPARTADFAYQAALALHHAHQTGLVHRDVKPSNLLLSPDGRVRLLDLGLARFLQDQIGEAHLTRTGAGMGTPDYCAPEQFRDARNADVRSDIYSLGCTLYHLIAGRVPFPGSSFSEKAEAHETKEPTPLEGLCPEVPAGLALAVGRMLAKRPADRFQTMADVAEALMPHVAGSSAAFPQIRKSATWDGSRLATLTARPRRRLAVWAGAAAAVLLLAGLVVLVGLIAWWFGPNGSQVAEKHSTEPARSDSSPKRDEPAAQAEDPNVLTVSKEEKDGGKFRTISAALETVKPGQTIRVVDSEVYRESLAITGASMYADITREAPAGAVLETTAPQGRLIEISGVPGVTLRQLRLRASSTQNATLVVANGNVSGLRLEGLELSSEGTGSGNNGFELLGTGATDGDPVPVIVQGCRFRGLSVAVALGSPKLELSVSRAAVRDGLFINCALGVVAYGKVNTIQIVGNRFWGAKFAALQLQRLSPSSERILLANNTCFECSSAFRLWDNAAKGKDVQIRNNLILGAERWDMYFVEAEDLLTARGFGDGSIVAKAYDIGHNWREGRRPAEADLKPWVAPAKSDVFKDKIDDVNRDAKLPEFLRPAKTSPLATAGAGNEDPSLPRYVGALPPEGTEPWDWDRAWRMPKDAQLLTVSKDAKDGGKYRTINDALKDAKPWATIRVLDGAEYEEEIVLEDVTKYLGLTLEADGGATLRLPSGRPRLVVIEDVPHARLLGFRLSDKGGSDRGSSLIGVSGRASGVVLARLEFAPTSQLSGILIKDATAVPGGPPMRVEGCVIRTRSLLAEDGISVTGTGTKAPVVGLWIRGNLVSRCLRGINLRGVVRDVQVVGNIIARCRDVGLQLEDLAAGSAAVLIANNTAFENGSAFRVWDNAPFADHERGQVEVVNNLFFKGTHCDMAYVCNPGMGKPQSLGNAKALLALWRFRRNRRDFSGTHAQFTLPSAEEDERLNRSDLAAVSGDDLDRVRPARGSPLTNGGAGAKDTDLPAYIGALAPEGVDPWDWDRTWRARMKKADAK
jgi:serine/threonine protein kinase